MLLDNIDDFISELDERLSDLALDQVRLERRQTTIMSDISAHSDEELKSMFDDQINYFKDLEKEARRIQEKMLDPRVSGEQLRELQNQFETAINRMGKTQQNLGDLMSAAGGRISDVNGYFSQLQRNTRKWEEDLSKIKPILDGINDSSSKTDIKNAQRKIRERLNIRDTRSNNGDNDSRNNNRRRTSVSESDFFSRTFGPSTITRVFDKMIATPIKIFFSGLSNTIKSIASGVVSAASSLLGMLWQSFKELTIQPMLEGAEKYIDTTNEISKEVKWSKGQYESFSQSLVNTIDEMHNKVGANKVLETAHQVVKMGIRDAKEVEDYTKTLTKLQLAIDVDASDMSELLELTKRLGSIGSQSIEKLGRSIRALDDANLVKALSNKDLMKFASKMSEIFGGNSSTDPDAFMNQNQWAMATYTQLNAIDPKAGEGYAKFLDKISNATKEELGELSVAYGIDAFEAQRRFYAKDQEYLSELYTKGIIQFAKDGIGDITRNYQQGFGEFIDVRTSHKIRDLGTSVEDTMQKIKEAKGVMTAATDDKNPKDNLDDAVSRLNIGIIQELKNSGSKLGLTFGELLRDTGVHSKDINYAVDKLTQIVALGFNTLSNILMTGMSAIKAVIDALLPGWMQGIAMAIGGMYLASRLLGDEYVNALIEGIPTWLYDVKDWLIANFKYIIVEGVTALYGGLTSAGHFIKGALIDAMEYLITGIASWWNDTIGEHNPMFNQINVDNLRTNIRQYKIEEEDRDTYNNLGKIISRYNDDQEIIRKFEEKALNSGLIGEGKRYKTLEDYLKVLSEEKEGVDNNLFKVWQEDRYQVSKDEYDEYSKAILNMDMVSSAGGIDKAKEQLQKIELGNSDKAQERMKHERENFHQLFSDYILGESTSNEYKRNQALIGFNAAPFVWRDKYDRDEKGNIRVDDKGNVLRVEGEDYLRTKYLPSMNQIYENFKGVSRDAADFVGIPRQYLDMFFNGAENIGGTAYNIGSQGIDFAGQAYNQVGGIEGIVNFAGNSLEVLKNAFSSGVAPLGGYLQNLLQSMSTFSAGELKASKAIAHSTEAIASSVSDTFTPVPAFEEGSTSVGSGTPMANSGAVPAVVHAGEMIVPKNMNPFNNGIKYSVSTPVQKTLGITSKAAALTAAAGANSNNSMYIEAVNRQMQQDAANAQTDVDLQVAQIQQNTKAEEQNNTEISQLGTQIEQGNLDLKLQNSIIEGVNNYLKLFTSFVKSYEKQEKIKDFVLKSQLTNLMGIHNNTGGIALILMQTAGKGSSGGGTPVNSGDRLGKITLDETAVNQFQKYANTIAGTEVDPNIVKALLKEAVSQNFSVEDTVHFFAQIASESTFNQSEISEAGAIGLGQLMPKTAKALGVDPYDMVQNIHGSAIYFKQQLDKFEHNYDLAHAAYNAGPGAVEKAGGIPGYAETIEYVKKNNRFVNKANDIVTIGKIGVSKPTGGGSVSGNLGNTMQAIAQELSDSCTSAAATMIYNAYKGQNISEGDFRSKFGTGSSVGIAGMLNNAGISHVERAVDLQGLKQALAENVDKGKPIYLYQEGGHGRGGGHALNRGVGSHATVIGRRLEDGRYEVYDSAGGVVHQLSAEEIFDASAKNNWLYIPTIDPTNPITNWNGKPAPATSGGTKSIPTASTLNLGGFKPSFAGNPGFSSGSVQGTNAYSAATPEISVNGDYYSQVIALLKGIARALNVDTKAITNAVIQSGNVQGNQNVSQGETNQSQQITIPRYKQYENGQGGVWDVNGWENMKDTGCAPTALAIQATAVTGKTITPSDVARWGVENNLRNDKPSLLRQGAEAFGYNVQVIESASNDNSQAALDALKKGIPVVVGVGGGNPLGIGGASGHYVVANGFDESGKVIINDPGLNDEYGGYSAKFTWEEFLKAQPDLYVPVGIQANQMNQTDQANNQQQEQAGQIQQTADKKENSSDKKKDEVVQEFIKGTGLSKEFFENKLKEFRAKDVQDKRLIAPNGIEFSQNDLDFAKSLDWVKGDLDKAVYFLKTSTKYSEFTNDMLKKLRTKDGKSLKTEDVKALTGMGFKFDEAIDVLSNIDNLTKESDKNKSQQEIKKELTPEEKARQKELRDRVTARIQNSFGEVYRRREEVVNYLLRNKGRLPQGIRLGGRGISTEEPSIMHQNRLPEIFLSVMHGRTERQFVNYPEGASAYRRGQITGHYSEDNIYSDRNSRGIKGVAGQLLQILFGHVNKWRQQIPKTPPGIIYILPKNQDEKDKTIPEKLQPSQKIKKLEDKQSIKISDKSKEKKNEKEPVKNPYEGSGINMDFSTWKGGEYFNDRYAVSFKTRDFLKGLISKEELMESLGITDVNQTLTAEQQQALGFREFNKIRTWNHFETAFKNWGEETDIDRWTKASPEKNQIPRIDLTKKELALKKYEEELLKRKEANLNKESDLTKKEGQLLKEGNKFDVTKDIFNTKNKLIKSIAEQNEDIKRKIFDVTTKKFEKAIEQSKIKLEDTKNKEKQEIGKDITKTVINHEKKLKELLGDTVFNRIKETITKQDKLGNYLKYNEKLKGFLKDNLITENDDKLVVRAKQEAQRQALQIVDVKENASTVELPKNTGTDSLINIPKKESQSIERKEIPFYSKKKTRQPYMNFLGHSQIVSTRTDLYDPIDIGQILGNFGQIIPSILLDGLGSLFGKKGSNRSFQQGASLYRSRIWSNIPFEGNIYSENHSGISLPSILQGLGSSIFGSIFGSFGDNKEKIIKDGDYYRKKAESAPDKGNFFEHSKAYWLKKAEEADKIYKPQSEKPKPQDTNIPEPNSEIQKLSEIKSSDTTHKPVKLPMKNILKIPQMEEKLKEESFKKFEEAVKQDKLGNYKDYNEKLGGFLNDNLITADDDKLVVRAKQEAQKQALKIDELKEKNWKFENPKISSLDVKPKPQEPSNVPKIPKKAVEPNNQKSKSDNYLEKALEAPEKGNFFRHSKKYYKEKYLSEMDKEGKVPDFANMTDEQKKLFDLSEEEKQKAIDQAWNEKHLIDTRQQQPASQSDRFLEQMMTAPKKGNLFKHSQSYYHDEYLKALKEEGKEFNLNNLTEDQRKVFTEVEENQKIDSDKLLNKMMKAPEKGDFFHHSQEFYYKEYKKQLEKNGKEFKLEDLAPEQQKIAQKFEEVKPSENNQSMNVPLPPNSHEQQMLSPRGIPYEQNDIDYLISKGYSYKDALTFLSQHPKYMEIKTEGLPKAPNGKEFEENDIRHLLMNGYNLDNALKFLATDKKYAFSDNQADAVNQTPEIPETNNQPTTVAPEGSMGNTKPGEINETINSQEKEPSTIQQINQEVKNAELNAQKTANESGSSTGSLVEWAVQRIEKKFDEVIVVLSGNRSTEAGSPANSNGGGATLNKTAIVATRLSEGTPYTNIPPIPISATYPFQEGGGSK